MNHRLSSDTERKLTSAVERAATLANSNPTTDRNKLLADNLLASGLDKQLAKTASAAFNRRITVLTFQRTGDDHKADSFPLTNADRVVELMGGQVQKKCAALQSAAGKGRFHISLEGRESPLKKTASAQQVHRDAYETTVSYESLERHLGSIMQKQAAEHDRLLFELRKLDSNIKAKRQEVRQMFNKAAKFDQQVLYNGYGDNLLAALDVDSLEGLQRKTAAAVDPEDKLSRKIASLLDDLEEYGRRHDWLAEYQDGLLEFSKTAADLAKDSHMHKMQHKTAAMPLAGNLALRYMPAAAAQMLGNVRKGMVDISDTVGNKVTDTYNDYQASVAPDAKASDVLTPEFFNDNRKLDRLLAWSDMAADKTLAAYPAAEVFKATQDAMDTDLRLENPANRELLRSYVNMRLAQNNRVSIADLAALATTLKDKNDNKTPSPEDEARLSAASITVTPKVTASPAVWRSTQGNPPVHDYIGDVVQALKDDRKALKEQAKEKEKQLKDEVAEAKKLEEAVHKADEARQKQLSSFLHAAGIHTSVARDGSIAYYDRGGIPISSSAVSAAFDTYLQNAVH